jgi:O-methyltransferase involved in polyketide biosynthesis
MQKGKIHLTKEKETYLAMLYGKALDSRSKNPILDDKFADEVVRRIDFDFEKLKVPKGAEITLPIRAKHLDQWTREFLTTNPNSTVLHLGCGLDSRVFRIDPPYTVRWYDIDMPDVIKLRRRLYPERHDYTLVDSSVTDLHWLDEIPADRPVLVVAEGLVQYLSEKEGLALFNRITEKFPNGEFIFDAYSRLTIKLISLLPTAKKAQYLFNGESMIPTSSKSKFPT